MDKLVSIIIPTYNSEKTIERCLNSVFNQSYQNYEILICDDKSKDNTRLILNSINDIRVKLFFLDENSGAAVARNTAMKNVKGDYIAFLDSDDEWCPNKIENQIKLFSENSIGITITGAFIDWNGKRKKTYRPNYDWEVDSYLKMFLGNIYYLTPTVIIRTECISKVGLMSEKLKRNQDYDFFLRILKHYKLKILTDPLCIIHVNSFKNVSYDFECSVKFYENEKKETFNKDFSTKHVNIFFARQYFNLACAMINTGDMLKGYEYTRKSLKYSKTYFLLPKSMILFSKSFIYNIIRKMNKR